MAEARILIVDDDPQIRRTMRTILARRGYGVGDVSTGEEAIRRLVVDHYDLILLDVTMPGISGIETCRVLRASSEIAIIMLTAGRDEKSKIEALDAGADDYVTKPFGTPELLARIRAALRRLAPSAGTGVQQLRLGNVEIDFPARRIRGPGGDVRMTPKEFDILSYLAARPDKIVSHRELLQAIWGPEYGEEVEYLRVFINRLRKKIEPDPAKPQFLMTEAWIGYRFHH